MESLLSGSRLTDELEFFKKQLSLVATQHVKYPNGYVPPLEHRPKKATLAEIPVCQPPAARNDEGAPAVESVTLTIKSSKPSLIFTLSCPSTASIGALKSLLAAEPSGPPAETQRWVLKGKAMGDAKLLREFAVEEGAVVNLMIKASVVPDVTVTTGDSDDPQTVPALSIEIPAEPTTDPFATKLSSPQLWIDAYALLQKQFGTEGVEAQRVWELWLEGSLSHISASDKALIRERVGITAMGGL